jgi:mannosyl-3-phosphoglycerate phosphatase
MKRLIIFTDLDGTLLDHESYSYEPARPVLARLKAFAIPVILASSKTAAEIAALRAELDLDAYPAIIENGAGILWPGDTGNDDDDSYERLRNAIDSVNAEGRFEGFGDWSIEEVARRTGLDRKAAELAKRRHFSEPGIFSGTESERDAFVSALAAIRLEARMGGRFLTISAPTSKAQRMNEIVGRLFGDQANDVMTIALGDAPNDTEMLEASDIGVIVANPAHARLPELAGEPEGCIRRTTLPGPAGWAEAIGALLDGMENPV